MKSDSFHLGDVVFDPATRTLTHKDGRPAQLRNKSKDVLARLLARPGQTVPKSEIFADVWSDVTVSDESLVQCIADIRRLIGPNARHIVETVPRKGYRINVQSPPMAPLRYIAAVAGAAVAVVCVAAWILWPVAEPAAEFVDLSNGTAVSTAHPGTFSTQAYLEVLKGRVSANRFSKEENLIAERHFRQAITLDPTYARAYAELATLLAVRLENKWTSLVKADEEKALFYAKKSASLDPDLWLAHYALGRLHSLFTNLNVAEKHLEKAMSLEPDNEDARAYYGVVVNLQGRAESAIEILEPTVKSHPDPPYWYHFGLGHAFFNAGRYEEAERELKRCLEVAQMSPYCLRFLIRVQGITGDTSAAEKTIRTYTSMGFEPSVAAMVEPFAFHNPDDLAKLKDAWRLAGVSD